MLGFRRRKLRDPRDGGVRGPEWRLRAGVACPACGADCDPPEEGEARSRTSRVGAGEGVPPAKSGWPMLSVHRGDEAFDLLDVRPFMASQPLRIGQHGSLEDLSRPRHRRRS